MDNNFRLRFGCETSDTNNGMAFILRTVMQSTINDANSSDGIVVLFYLERDSFERDYSNFIFNTQIKK